MVRKSCVVLRRIFTTAVLAGVLFYMSPMQAMVDPWPREAPVLSHGSLSDNEIFLVEQALASINMSWSDLGFRKDYVDDDFRLSVAQRALDDPYSLVVWNYEWDNFLLDRKDPSQILLKAAADLDSDLYNQVPLTEGTSGLPHASRFPLLPENWQGPVSELDKSVRIATERYNQMVLNRLTPDDLEYLSWYLECHFSEDENSDCPETEPYEPPQQFLDAMLGFNMPALVAISRELSRSVEGTIALLSNVDETITLGQPVAVQGMSGTILIGTEGNDFWNMNGWPSPSIIIDPGGDDVYYGPVAAGGKLQDESFPTVSVALDFDGNDIYINDGRSNGSGVLGIGIQFDLTGDDTYRNGDFSSGCGLFGTGVMVDKSGNDIYESGLLVQGAGATGLGLLIDESGNDNYIAALYAQGMGYVRGWGMLTDRDGFDTYYAGGVYDDFPRYPDSNISLSQGFAIGLRPAASGGIGILHDRNGNDFYTAEVYGQGVSYWYSIGALIDDNGNDWYQAQQYSQGSGIHLSSGILLDRAGTDRYSSRSCTQGFGHDLAVGWLIDEGGDDYYTASDLAQGSGNANGLGILIDREGGDGYFGRNPEACTGYGTPSRGYGSIGILIDVSGPDTYTYPGAGDGMWWTKSFNGVGIDVGDDWWNIRLDSGEQELSRTLMIPGTEIPVESTGTSNVTGEGN